MPDSPLVPWANPASVSQTRVRWDIEIGRVRVGLTRTRETRGLGPRAAAPARARPAWPLAIGAFASVSALALLVVGAGATRPVEPARYTIALDVPPPVKARVARLAFTAPTAGRTRRHLISLHAAVPDATGARFDAADEPYVAAALATGAMQEWVDAAGQRRFLTAGPARAVGGRTCRDMALLIRLADGGSHVRSAERCTSSRVIDSSQSVAAADSTDGSPAS